MYIYYLYMYKNAVSLCCRFNCLIYATVVPGLDVAAVQSQMHLYLNGQYHPAGLLLLVAHDSVRTTAVGQFSHPASA